MLSIQKKHELESFLLERAQNSQFFYEETLYTPEDDEDELQYICKGVENDLGCDVLTGATKLVLVFDEIEDYVFKVPFIGSYFTDVDTNEVVYTDFECAKYLGGNSSWDYCEAETSVYELAEEEEVSQFFAGTFFLGTIFNRPVYVSERMEEEAYDHVKTVSNDMTKRDIDFYRSIEKESNFILSVSIIATLIEDFGFEEVLKLMNFATKRRLNDFHEHNLMLDGNGKLRIVDYSGYNEY